MIKTVREYIEAHQLIPPEVKTIYVAVSGGVDSCVLLHILLHIKEELKYDLHILHYNHRTRGKESQRDEAFVESLSRKYGLKITIGRLPGNTRRISETLLREYRMKFFEKHIANKRNNRIATGHNLNDNVETFLMRMAKGSRLKGLMGINPRRGNLIRPLLAVSRREIIEYARHNKIEFQLDSSNQDNSILRNKIRNNVIPYLQKSLAVDLVTNIPHIMQDLGRYYEIYQENLHQAIAICTKKTKSGISLHRKRFLMYNQAIQRGLVEYCISGVYPLNYKVSDRNLTAWKEFIEQAQVGRQFMFMDDGIAIAERQHVLFGKIPKTKSERFRLKLNSMVTVTEHSGIRFDKVAKKSIVFTHDKNVEYIDGDKSGKNLTVRFWQKGDAFKPLGMPNKRKLSDFFTDLKISTMFKKEIPLVCKNDTIIWIAGYRLDEGFKVADNTKTVYKLELVHINNK